MSRRARALETARRIYGEVVRGRTRVKVISDQDNDESTRPRFLLSPYRSGTTLFRYCIDSHPDIASPPETDFISPLTAILDDEASMKGLSDMGYGADLVSARLGTFARSFLDTYASGRGATSGWMDKSPRYAENPYPLRRLFPSARYVILHRHPLDQVHSFTRGGTFSPPSLGSPTSGRELVVRASRYWDNVTRGLLDFSHGATDTVSITYEDLNRFPRETLGDVLTHFELPWRENVLNYHEHDHDKGRESGRIAGTVGFSMVSGKWSSWPDDWVEAAWATVSSTAQRLGYAREGV